MKEGAELCTHRGKLFAYPFMQELWSTHEAVAEWEVMIKDADAGLGCMRFCELFGGWVIGI